MTIRSGKSYLVQLRTVLGNSDLHCKWIACHAPWLRAQSGSSYLWEYSSCRLMSIWRLFPKGFRPGSQLVMHEDDRYCGILTHLEVGWSCSVGADYSWVLLSDRKWCNLLHPALWNPSA